MTEQDKTRFKQAFNRLAVATRLQAETVDPAMQVIYFEGMQDIPIEAIEAGAVTLARESQWFPKLAEWRAAALREKFTLTIRALPAVTTPLHCAACSDTGWMVRDCVVGSRCGRPRCAVATETYTHTYSHPCACRETNPNYQHDRLASFRASVRELDTTQTKALLTIVRQQGQS